MAVGVDAEQNNTVVPVLWRNAFGTLEFKAAFTARLHFVPWKYMHACVCWVCKQTFLFGECPYPGSACSWHEFFTRINKLRVNDPKAVHFTGCRKGALYRSSSFLPVSSRTPLWKLWYSFLCTANDCITLALHLAFRSWNGNNGIQIPMKLEYGSF